MNYQLEKSEGKVKFTFTILPEEWEQEVNNAYLKTKNRYNIPGFRKGHAPRKTIESFYGKGVFFDEAINDCVKKGYSQALSEHDEVYPVDEPQVDISKFDDKEIVFTVEVVVKPTVKLGAYTGINLEKVEYTVKQDDIKAVIERDKRAHVRMTVIKDRAVQNGDKLNIDYSGKVDGVKFEGGTAEKQELVIGSNTFIPGFEEQLVGMLIGETKDITVKFPDDYHAKNLAGKDAVFTVTVNAGVVEELPAEDDGFAQEMGAFETFDDYKKDVKKHLEEDAKTRAKYADENNLIKAIVDNAELNVPDCMVNTQLDYELDDLARRLSANGLRLGDYFKYIGSSEEEFRKTRHDDAMTTVRTRLVIEELVKELVSSGKIQEVSEKDVDDKLEEMTKDTKMKASDLKASGQAVYVKNELTMDRAMAFLTANNNFTKPTKKAAEKGEDGAKSEGEAKAPKAKSVKKTAAKEAEEAPAETEQKPAKAKKTAKKSDEPAEAEGEEKAPKAKKTSKKSE